MSSKKTYKHVSYLFDDAKLPAGSPELDPWTWLMKSAAHAHLSPSNTWRAVRIT